MGQSQITMSCSESDKVYTRRVRRKRMMEYMITYLMRMVFRWHGRLA
jgi:hypothetical protein